MKVNERLMRKSQIDCDLSGAACIQVFIDVEIEQKGEEIMNYGKLIVSNLGDFRILEFYQNDNNVWLMRQLNSDLNLLNFSESQRITQSGGVIEKERDALNTKSEQKDKLMKEERVYYKEQNVPGIELSRSFGNVMAR